MERKSEIRTLKQLIDELFGMYGTDIPPVSEVPSNLKEAYDAYVREAERRKATVIKMKQGKDGKYRPK